MGSAKTFAFFGFAIFGAALSSMLGAPEPLQWLSAFGAGVAGIVVAHYA